MKLPLRSLLAVSVLLACAACASTGKDAPDAPKGGDAKAAPKGDDPDEEADKLRKKERELECAKMELEIAKLGAAADEREADTSVKDATLKLEAARKDQGNFLDLDKPTQVAGGVGTVPGRPGQGGGGGGGVDVPLPPPLLPPQPPSSPTTP